jgi:5-methylcytosine-specific restriction endonuclease McrA
MSKLLKHPRTIACLRQSGRCYYCTLPMWSGSLSEFASKYRLTVGQARVLRCTGEHLTARQDGGNASTSNIVAACVFCNQHRHRRKNPPAPESYKRLVNARLR